VGFIIRIKMNENQNETSVLSQTNLLGLGTNLALDHVLPLLLLANRVSKLQNFSQSEMANLREKLINDILSTTSKISNLSIYEEDDIIRLRYCLCVFIDESLLKNEIFMNSFWANNTLTTRFFNENLGGNKFFGIMDKWFENVGKNKDFLLKICIYSTIHTILSSSSTTKTIPYLISAFTIQRSTFPAPSNASCSISTIFFITSKSGFFI